jgi:hypothetical protein
MIAVFISAIGIAALGAFSAGFEFGRRERRERHGRLLTREPGARRLSVLEGGLLPENAGNEAADDFARKANSWRRQRLKFHERLR